jgi:vanillate O-demethylase ferredoxin subunit
MKSNSAWTDALLASLEDLTPSVREFRLRPEGGVLPHAPGSHLLLEVQIKGRPQIRSYSLVGEPDGQTYRIAVKRLAQGRGGSLAMWQLPVGARLRVSAPQNHFALDFNAPAYLLVAGGIGITPLLRMAYTLAQRSAASGRPVRMLYGARTADELAFLAELKQQLGERLRTVVGAAMDFAAEIAALPAGGQMYVCGPAPMLDAARSAWLAAGRPEADLRFETFGSSGASAPQAFRVQIPRHGLDITVPADCSLLEALEQAGIEQLYDCQRGECGLCALDVLALDGTIDHRDVFLSAHEKQQNTRLCACVSRVTGSITLDSAWRPEP